MQSVHSKQVSGIPTGIPTGFADDPLCSVQTTKMGARNTSDGDVQAKVAVLVKECGTKAVVSALCAASPPTQVMSALATVGIDGRMAGAKGQSRFLDGAGGGDDVDEPVFYAANEKDFSPSGMLPTQVSQWTGFCGGLWNKEERTDMVGTAWAVVARSKSKVPRSEAVALYTLCVLQRIVWAFRVGSEPWEPVSEREAAVLDSLLPDKSRSIVVPTELLSDAFPHIGSGSVALSLVHECELLFGGVCSDRRGEECRLVRYINRYRGDEERCHLHDTVLWLVEDEPIRGSCLSDAAIWCPFPGVLETLQSLAVYGDYTVLSK
eukprot:Hpha_TRINITY_DN19468_c0_g1::TRINITY_DN19468_c0_g1_i1::g.45852::m.45852